MLQSLFARLPFARLRTLTLFRRNDQLKTDSTERRERWNQVIAEHQRPLDKAAGPPSPSR